MMSLNKVKKAAKEQQIEVGAPAGDDSPLVVAEKGEEQAENTATGPFGWLPKLFRK